MIMKHIKITHGSKVYERDIPTEWDELDADGMMLAAMLWTGGLPRDELLAKYYGVPMHVVCALGDYLSY